LASDRQGQELCFLLAKNDERFDRFKPGMSSISLNAPLAAAELTKQDQIIEEALINYAEFMKRVIHVLRCEPYVQESTEAKKAALYTPYVTAGEAVDLLRQWGRKRRSSNSSKR
jgi:hypothetical protein